ncbi:hypothetical protein V6N13_010621 [Hibiscus sabdariffa]|uniref:Uncharacterized protein n=1 Tax=Hibiscus sabdariffa TaxID=183260 RepID=A0ABR1ZKR1_9ROSI
MRIRKRFPSFPVTPSSVASSTEAPPQQEEMEVSSFPVPAERIAREASREHVLTDWKDIMARAHKMLGGSSHTANHRTVQSGVPEEHSTTGPVINEEAVIELQSGNGRNKSLLEQENPTKTMVIKQGGRNERKEKKRNYSGTGISKQKRTDSSSWKGNSKYGKAETAMRIDGQKERAKVRLLMEAGYQAKDEGEDEDEDEEGYTSGSNEKKVKTRSLTSIYADIRSLMPAAGSSKLNHSQDSEESFSE